MSLNKINPIIVSVRFLEEELNTWSLVKHLYPEISRVATLGEASVSENIKMYTASREALRESCLLSLAHEEPRGRQGLIRV